MPDPENRSLPSEVVVAIDKQKPTLLHLLSDKAILLQALAIVIVTEGNGQQSGEAFTRLANGADVALVARRGHDDTQPTTRVDHDVATGNSGATDASDKRLRLNPLLSNADGVGFGR